MGLLGDERVEVWEEVMDVELWEEISDKVKEGVLGEVSSVDNDGREEEGCRIVGVGLEGACVGELVAAEGGGVQVHGLEPGG